MLESWKTPLAALAVVLLVPACGDDSPGIPSGGGDITDLDGAVEDDAEEFGEAVNDALGAGGGGTLIFDGEEIPIASALCVIDGDLVDVGTVSDNGFRVFISRSNPANDMSVQILDADFLQWFPRGVAGDEAVRNGSTFTSGPHPYFNNSDDRVVEASLTVNCP